jgi:hypothetical protein
MGRTIPHSELHQNGKRVSGSHLGKNWIKAKERRSMK